MSKMQSAHPILVAVRTPTRAARALVRKAALLAKLYSAPLRIVHVLAIPQGVLVRAGAAIQQAAQADFEIRSTQLERLTALPELRGLEVKAVVRCDYPVQDALVREVQECHARMLVVESHRPARLARLLLTNIDWELIRNCPCPLWLSKSARFDPRTPVIAAVDPLHAHAKPAMLDEIIVSRAIEVAGARPSRVLLCHAYNLPQGAVADTPVEAYWIAMSEQEQQAYKENLDRAIGRLGSKQGVPAKNSLLVRGDPAAQLPRLAKKHAAGVVVMGAVSRRGLKRVFIGNTAERVIDRLSCDVLVVKPRGFKSPVERQAYRRSIRRPGSRSLVGRPKQSGDGIAHQLH